MLNKINRHIIRTIGNEAFQKALTSFKRDFKEETLKEYLQDMCFISGLDADTMKFELNLNDTDLINSISLPEDSYVIKIETDEKIKMTLISFNVKNPNLSLLPFYVHESVRIQHIKYRSIFPGYYKISNNNGRTSMTFLKEI